MLFFSPCVLFSGENSWLKTGVTDLINVWHKTKTQEKSKQHTNNILSLSLLGKQIFRSDSVSSKCHLVVGKHSEQVGKNRCMLNMFINCIHFCGALKLALTDYNEINKSQNSFSQSNSV